MPSSSFTRSSTTTAMSSALRRLRGTLGVSGVNIKPAIKAIPVVKSLVKSFRAAGLPVLWTVQEHVAADAKRDRKRLPSHTAKRKQVASLAGALRAGVPAS